MLFGIPLAVFSSLGSFLMSFLAARFKSRMEIEEAKHKRTLELFAAQNEAAATFMQGEEIKQQDAYFSFTRRTLALGVTFGTMFCLFALPLFWPEVMWIYETTVNNPGFFGIGASVTTEFVTVAGIPISFGEAFLHFVGMVIAFYFGNRLGTVRNPY